MKETSKKLQKFKEQRKKLHLQVNKEAAATLNREQETAKKKREYKYVTSEMIGVKHSLEMNDTVEEMSLKFKRIQKKDDEIRKST